MSEEYAPAVWIPTAHHGGFGVAFAPRYLILHGTAGGSSAQAIARYFQTNNPPSSTHYVIGQDGEVAQCVSEAEAAWGNGVLSSGHAVWWTGVGNPNTCTFSIEHCKPSTDNSDTLTPAQQAASFALVQHLCETHGIPMRPADAGGGITGHFSIDPVNRARCPGPYPWDELWAYLGAYLTGGSAGGSSMATMAGVPAGWRDDGTTLTAPNGGQFVLGFRRWVLGEMAAGRWDARWQPFTGEAYAANLNQSYQAVVMAGMLHVVDDGRGQPWLSWDYDAAGAYRDAVGQAASQEAQAADLQSQLNTANARMATLEQQVSAVVAGDPMAAAALALVRQLAAVLAQIGTAGK